MFAYPSAVASDTSGSKVWIADMHNNQIRILDMQTYQVSTLVGGFLYPMGLAAWQSGSHYMLAVTEHLRNRIQVVNTDSMEIQLVAGDGGEGCINSQGPNAQFAFPRGLTATSEGQIIVADTDNSRIRVLSQGVSGSWETQSIRGEVLNFPAGIALSPQETSIYVANTQSHELIVMGLEDLEDTC